MSWESDNRSGSRVEYTVICSFGLGFLVYAGVWPQCVGTRRGGIRWDRMDRVLLVFCIQSSSYTVSYESTKGTCFSPALTKTM